MPALPESLTIGELAARSGVSTPTLRFYESLGLIASSRTAGNQRRYRRDMLRRVAAIRAAQQVGVSLAEIKAAMATLPAGRTPTTRDWRKLSGSWRRRLDGQIQALESLRDSLDDCIGCGCLSLTKCGLLNGDDSVARRGPGARYLLGDPRPQG